MRSLPPTRSVYHFSVFWLIAFLLILISPEALAAGGGGLPWEQPMDTLRQSLSGPVALAVSIIAIVIAGGMLIFGGELSEFARRMVMVVLVLALLVAANDVLNNLYTASAAVVS
jgi:type IV secretion system protein VirB2